MAIIYTPMTETLLENTSMEIGTESGVAKKYRITPNEGYVLHDKSYDTYLEYDEIGNGVGEPILGYRTSTASCTVAQFNNNEREFYAVPASSVSADQIFGNTDTEVM